MKKLIQFFMRLFKRKKPATDEAQDAANRIKKLIVKPENANTRYNGARLFDGLDTNGTHNKRVDRLIRKGCKLFQMPGGKVIALNESNAIRKSANKTFVTV